MIVKFNEDARETALRKKVKWVICWMTVSAIATGRRDIPVKKVRRFISLISKSKQLKESQISKIKVGSLGILRLI